jgi:ATP-dependent DNA ligase
VEIGCMPAFDRLALPPPIEPMEARAAATLPVGDEWNYEPKWDGFRCVAFRDGSDVELESKSGQSLTRYFPEVVAVLVAAPETRFVVDGEIFVDSEGGFDFDALLQRIHPAATRVARLAKETPATYALFDLLAEGSENLSALTLRERRSRLERFVAKQGFPPSVALSPSTLDVELARRWLGGDVARLDGVIAKRDVAYDFGGRNAVVKVKRRYTADCVIGGFRASPDGAIASLLLGLYEDGVLHHVGFVGSMDAKQRAHAAALLRPIVEPPGFTGNAPSGSSRWRKGEASEWFPVRPSVVVEVAFDHVTGRRFRHGAKLLRWRPDKDPAQCTMEQLFDPS